MLSITVRHWLCAVPQAGWGGTTLDGYVRSVDMRPEIAGDEAECQAVLDAMVAAGHVQVADPSAKLIKDPDAPKVDLTEEPRWELTESGHEALIAPIDADGGAEAYEVILELQPGVGISTSDSEATA